MTKHRLFPFLLIVLLFLVSVCLKLTIVDGRFTLSLLENLIAGKTSTLFVFNHVRLPVLIAATVSSVLMVMATFILQAVSHNELADPSALGFQNIAITVLAVGSLYFPLAKALSYGQILALAALSVLGFSFVMYRFAMSDDKDNQGNLLLLTGIGVNSFFQMILTYIKTYSSEANDLLSILMQGNFDSLDLPLAIGLSLFAGLIFLIFTSQYSQLRLMQLDHAVSQSLGFNRRRGQLILFSILALAVTTSLMFGSSFPFVAFTAIYATKPYYSLQFGWHFASASLFMASAILISDVLAHELFDFIIPTNIFLGLFSGLGFLVVFLQRRSKQW